jgi:CO/xanthine dehydrogenase Mo-binding subunit
LDDRLLSEMMIYTTCADGPLGVKGAGEIGIVGTANAIYHATGKRGRDLRITIDKLLGH